MAQAPALRSSDAPNGTTASSGSSKDLPRDARIVSLILASQGVTEAEPAVIAMLLEFAHRYTQEILSAATVFAEHAQRAKDTAATGLAPPLEVDDLRLAVSSKLEHSYSSPLPKDYLLPLASAINHVPLPILPESYGIRLPPERERLTAVNWDIIPLSERREFLTVDQQLASASMLSAAVGDIANPSNNMDVDLAAHNELFGGQDDDDDDDDEEDMEEVTHHNAEGAGGRDKEAEGDGEDEAEGEADGDGDGEGEAEVDADGDGDADDNDDEEEEEGDGDADADGRGEDDDYEA